MSPDLTLDLLRGPHLFGVVLGMGAAMYFDLRTLSRLMQPVSRADLDELHRIHQVISIAFASLWITGALLIGYRTGFAMDAFSPKLWSKIIVVTALTANAVVLSKVIIPRLARFEGSRLLELPSRLLLGLSVVAGLSLSCWLLAFCLGFSKVLKTAGWDLLTIVLSGGLISGVGGVMLVLFGLRAFCKQRATKAA